MHEPIPGLPEELPQGEELRWQGSPNWRSLARHAFHVRKVAIYFAAILVWRLIEAAGDGLRGPELFAAATWPVAFGVVAIGGLMLLAWLNARSTRYTITNRRVVMRFGVALPIAMNLPLKRIEAAALSRSGEHVGSIPLQLVPGTRVSYLVSWPHVRPWCFSRPQPMLREIEDVDAVARILADCWAQAPGTQPAAPATTSSRFGPHEAGLAT